MGRNALHPCTSRRVAFRCLPGNHYCAATCRRSVTDSGGNTGIVVCQRKKGGRNGGERLQMALKSAGLKVLITTDQLSLLPQAAFTVWSLFLQPSFFCLFELYAELHVCTKSMRTTLFGSIHFIQLCSCFVVFACRLFELLTRTQTPFTHPAIFFRMVNTVYICRT